MELFTVETHRVKDNNNGTFYYELIPTNTELKDLLLHGHDDEIVGTIEETIATETVEHRVEMFEVLEMIYPDIALNYYL
jgi:hypothetical protein